MSLRVADPARSDVLIHREAPGHFTVALLHGVPQFDCVDFEHALSSAARLPARTAAALWYASINGNPRRLTDVFTIRRLCNEYIDLPGLHLTRDQIRRLLDVDVPTCDDVIAVLMEVGLLQRSPDGTYRRAIDEHASIRGDLVGAVSSST